MANLKEIKARISSVSSTMKITSAMKMVSAAKLKKSQDKITNIQPYAEGFEKTIQNLLPSANSLNINLTTGNNQSNKVLLINITSNRGLCGGFNANVFKKTKDLVKNKFQDKVVDIFCIGKKSHEAAKRAGYNVINSDDTILEDCRPKLVKQHSDEITAKFLEGEWSSVYIIYNKFKNAATQIITEEKFLPIQLDLNNKNITLKDYIVEPGKLEVINGLLPKKLEIQLFKSILDSIASEHGARMTAMHKATDNAQELKHDLTLTYNRQRQAAITNEILEIVAGAEALRGA
tara:strand:+ start:1212 stop:2081 length:870 start_codon:yes stop_codon:yes gene_type:complete